MVLSRAKPRIGLILGLLLALPGTAGAKEADLSDWPDGPIRYIARKAEIQTFKVLESDEDRALFIEKFWARRDPSPETLANEYRQLFWERVAEANERFLDSHKAGSMTDRGKIHILHGPPTDIQEELDLKTQGIAGGGRGVVRWIYQGRPDERADMDPIIVVPFVRPNTGGEYRISHDPELASVFWDPLLMREREYHQVDRLIDSLGTPRRSELSVMLDLGKMQEIPTQAQVLLERVETMEAYRTRPIDVDVGLYRHPETEGTVAVVTVAVDDLSSDLTPSIVARFVPRDATAIPRVLGEDSFRMAGERRRLAQARLVLDPGSYDLTVMLFDPGSGSTGLHRAMLRIPPPSDGLYLSRVTWAEELRPLEYAGLASHDEPYHVGPFRVVPRLDSTFVPGETVKLFYEVYGGQAPFRIAYQLEGEDDDGSWVTLGAPSVGERPGGAQGWDLATKAGWPAGNYRIRIDVDDAAGRLISAQMPFRLEPPETVPGE